LFARRIFASSSSFSFFFFFFFAAGYVNWKIVSCTDDRLSSGDGPKDVT
jgi:hypothetical protein